MTDEHKRKISESNKIYWKNHKRIPWNKNKKCPKISSNMIGNKNGYGNKGKILSKETKEKLRQANLGKKNPKHSEFMKGRPAWNKGLCGRSSHSWKGGLSYLPYSVDWTKTLKRSIRERDKYTCQMCGNQQEDIALDIHHIDYNKENCDPNNLITLCHSCHSKTNHNREYWKEYLSIQAT